jgi:zinc protease
MKKKMSRIILFLLVGSISCLYAQSIKDINIPYQKFVLKNGLTLIVHEDHKAPIVAVNVWYHVGSKNEKPGRTGFAHLFEHLMFNGSENNNDDYFKAMEKVGATDLNGTTNNDRTNYFQNVPTSAFDVALWMESDRMGHLIGAIDQAKLDEQRGVVQNEKRQYDNEPYSISEELITVNTYPVGHPYSWTVIGAMEDLSAAKLEDVHEWFKTYYGAQNAVLCIAGDIKAEDVLKKVEKYFGDIPSGPPIGKHETYISKMTGTHRQVAQDRVPQSKIYKVWNVPEWGNKELAYLDIASDVLSIGKTSRLYKRLVYDEQIATNVRAYLDMKEIGSQFVIEATAKPGEDLSKIEKAIDEELARFLKEGPTENEMKRVKTQYVSNFVRGIERIGGFGGKSDILAQSFVYGGSPDYYKTTLEYITNSTSKDLKDAAVKWLSDGVYILEIHPYPEFQTINSDVDRTKLPETGTPPDAKFPAFEKTTLSNGLKIILAKRSSIPVVNFNLLIDAGFSADQFTLSGVSSLAMNVLDEGTKTKSSLEISEELLMLGANLGTGAGLDMSNVFLSSLKSNIDKSLELYADVILNPSFPEKEIDRLKKERFAQIKREKVTPIQMALRVFPQFLFGKDHAYGNPLTGSGYEETVKNIKREDLINYHKTWFKPNNATLVIVGDITLDEIKPKLEKLFKDWKPGDVPKKNISEVKQKDKPIVYLVDKPGSPQSVLLAGHLAPPRSDPENIAIESMNNILGGTFTSRINMNLREDKHWSYGAASFIMGAKGQRPFLAYAFIQSDKTKESIQEIYKEISGIIGTKPATEDELNKIKLNQILELPGSWETNNAVAQTLVDMVTYNLPDNYIETYINKVKSLNLDDINKNAKRVLHPDNIVWIVVGDKAKIESSIKELGYEIKLIDGDGKVLQ